MGSRARAWLAVSCVAVSGPALAATHGIVGGVEEEAFPYAVAIGAELGEYRLTMCSASLITPRLLLTAAHCGDGIPIEVVVQAGAAFFGPRVETAEAPVGLANLTIHPDYRPLDVGELTDETDLGQFDLAIIELEEAVDVEPVWFRQHPFTLEETEGAEVTSVGYGASDGATGDGSGVRRSAALRIDELDAVYLVSRSSSNLGRANICNGDSGGPQYHLGEDGRWVQWAVHSWGDELCVVTSGSTRVDIASEWILDQIEEVHGTRDLCEAHGLYDNGSCDAAPWCEAVDPECLIPEEPRACACDTGMPAPGWWALALGWLLRRRQTASSRVSTTRQPFVRQVPSFWRSSR